jgi:hypothetical protein
MKPNTLPFVISNNAHLKIGERVVCSKTINFIDGTTHYRGKTYMVEPDTQAYFSLFTGTSEQCNYFRIDDVK